ncbi:MAG: DUF3105 domain-containing protein [Candidatus Limnocylindria bacterium]
MAKRRTSGIQRRQRASADALNRRLDAPGGSVLSGLPDWRLLAIGGLLVVGVILVVAVLVFGSGPNPNAGVAQPNAGQEHVTDGTNVRATQTAAAYSSTPATSGPHWNSPANWGVYEAPQPESQLVHNLEHGGIVIWYQPDAVDADGVAELENLVRSQVSQGVGGRFKFIVSPWEGPELEQPIAVTAWTFLLFLDDVDLDAIRGFADAHYGLAPEPNGGPPAPAG